MNKFFSDLLIVDGKYNMKRVLVALFVVMLVISWIVQQFFLVNIPEYMFHLLADLIKSAMSDSPTP